MCRVASLLPTPRDPECRNSQTRSRSSRLTSMKWLPEPSEPGDRTVQCFVDENMSQPRCSLAGTNALVAVAGLPPAVDRHQAVIEAQFLCLAVGPVVHPE